MTKRRPSAGETDLWRAATRDVRPMVKNRLTPSPPAKQTRPVLKRDLLSSAAPADIRERPTSSAAAPGLTGHSAGMPGSAFGAGDPRRDRLVARGRLPIERTLDLHGLTQAAAEPRVYGFIETAHRDHCRCVLVITGKGAPDPINAAGAGPTGARRGVLRARFAVWIESPRIRPLVARISQARQSDGGAGAFYVFLKRNTARSAQGNTA